jgi:GNAT superfamily N-acetyltransferase
MIDVRIVVEAELDTLVATFPEKGARPRNRHVERFARQARGDVTCLVAWDEGIPVGYVFLRWPGGHGGLTEQARKLGCVELGDLFVAEHARRRGVGRKLMEVAEGLATRRGFAVIGLEVTVSNPFNELARGLYQKLGYRDSELGTFVSGYTYWDSAGHPQRDEELHCYLVKKL